MADANRVIRVSIREELKRRGMSQTDFAQQLGVSQSYVSQVLGGRRGLVPQSLEKMLDALDLEIRIEPKS